MLLLSSEFIQRLNAQYQGGLFVKVVELVEDPDAGPLIRYFVDHTEPITWNGNTYNPLHMAWDNIKTSAGMPIDAATISISNIEYGGVPAQYIKTIDVTDNEVTLRILHLDLLNEITGHWVRTGTVLAVSGDVSVITFTVGRRLGRNVLPRKIFLQRDWPGLSSEIPRIFS